MRDDTAHALAELNRRFYEERAADFDETRGHAWRGWERCLDALVPPGRSAPVRVLDVGCGNGRLAGFLAERAGSAFAYRGIDASETLLALARRRLGARAGLRFERHDLLDPGFPGVLGSGGQDAVALFGVLHHVPGRARREALAAGLARALAPGGSLVATIWRADRFERFRDRFVPAADCAARTGIPIDPTDLEPGDVLLPWKHDPAALRYCHFPDEAESQAFIAATGLDVHASFDADGREGELNRYWLLGPR